MLRALSIVTYDYVRYFVVARHLDDLKGLLLKLPGNRMLNHPRVKLMLQKTTKGSLQIGVLD